MKGKLKSKTVSSEIVHFRYSAKVKTRFSFHFNTINITSIAACLESFRKQSVSPAVEVAEIQQVELSVVLRVVDGVDVLEQNR